MRQALEVAAAKLLDQSILLSLVKLFFSSASICLLINRWSFTEPVAVGVRVLGLGSKLYPSNMPCMLNKDPTRFVRRLSRVCQNQTSKKKAPLAGWVFRLTL